MSAYEIMAVMVMVIHIIVDLLIALDAKISSRSPQQGVAATYALQTGLPSEHVVRPAPFFYLYYTTFHIYVNSPPTILKG